MTQNQMQLKTQFHNQLDYSNYTIPSSIPIDNRTQKQLIEKLVRQRKIAPLYPSCDCDFDDDKECIICFETVRQGMNALMCCGNKRFICSNCLLYHPKFNIETCQLYCDMCRKTTYLSIPKVNEEVEWNKIINAPKKEKQSIQKLVEETNKKAQFPENPLKNVNKNIIDKFASFGIQMRTDVDVEMYNFIDVDELTDFDLAMAIMLSL